jgi:hypothetical protein
MPRAIWSGSISFGLVNIPVKLYAAVSRKNGQFNQLDSRTGARIKYKKVSAESGDEVPNDDIVKGYELPRATTSRSPTTSWPQLDPEGQPHHRHRGVRRPRRHRPDLLRRRLLPRPGQGHGQALRAAGPGHGGGGQGRHRPLRDAHQAVPAAVRPQDGRWCCRHGLRRRGQRPGRDPRARRARRRRGLRQGAGHGEPAHRVARRLRPREVPRHLPRQGARPHRAQGRRRGGRGRGRPSRRRRRWSTSWPRSRRRSPRPRRPASATPRPAVAGHGAGRGDRQGDQERRREARAPPRARDRSSSSSSTATASSSRNLDKVLYPEAGFTKAEVIDYYARIAPVMLPHIAGPGRHAEAVPRRRRGSRSSRSAARRTGPTGWHHRRARRPGRHHRLLRLDSVAALVWAANLAALEIHAPMALGADIESPTMCVFDLDPGARHHRRVRRGRPRASATCSPARPRVPGQDVGLQGAAALRAAQHPPHPRPLPASFAHAVAQVLEKHHPDGSPST